MTKEELLKTGYFIDNIYLNQYIELINKPFSFTVYFEFHHVIPVHFYKQINKCTTKEAIIIADADTRNKKVQLSFIDHCKAHWLLLKCGTNYYANKYAITKMLKRLLDNSKIKKPWGEVIELGLTDDEYKEIEKLRLSIGRLSAEEKIWIMQNYKKYSYTQMANYLGYNYPNARYWIRNICKILGCKKGRNDTWTRKEINELKKYYPTHSITDCIKKFNRSANSIKTKAARLNLTKSTFWTKEEEEWLLLNYGKYTVSECAKFLDKSKYSIFCKISRLKRNCLK